MTARPEPPADAAAPAGAADTSDPALPAPIRTDALVIGAGPAGLWAVFELGLLALSAQVVDALPHPGGQCAELYPAKPIYDLPGLPCISGEDLVAQLLRQVAPFKPGLHLGQQVARLARRADGRFTAVTDRGQVFDAGVVLIAAGAGAFVPRRLDLPGLAALEGRQVHLHRPDAARRAGWAGQQVLVLGDQEPALEEALALAEAGQAAGVTLMHRRRQFRAEPALVARLDALEAAGRLRFVAAQAQAAEIDAVPGTGAPTATDPATHTAAHRPSGRLRALSVVDSQGATLRLPVDQLLPLLGISPKLGPIADWGLALERRQLVVDSARFQTSEPGIFAVGDINTYPGKKKLLLCGFHEATLAAFAAAERLRPGEPMPLQYTTTSPRLQALLGVGPAAGAGPAGP